MMDIHGTDYAIQPTVIPQALIAAKYLLHTHETEVPCNTGVWPFQKRLWTLGLQVVPRCGVALVGSTVQHIWCKQSGWTPRRPLSWFYGRQRTAICGK